MSKVVVLSADALVHEDMETLSQQPNFKKYISNRKNGGYAFVERVKSIYPTITYPCHATMCTGLYPNRHGIEGNLIFEATTHSHPWKWFHDELEGVPDIFTAAKKAGKTTAAVFWPITGNHPDIDYLINEYWSQSEGDSIEDVFRRSGSSEELMEIVIKNQPLLEGHQRQHPLCDQFVISCAADILRTYKPDLMMIHPADVDGARHKYGVFNDKVTQSVLDTDHYIGQLCQALEEAGTLDETDFFLVSDHGQMDIKRIVNVNVLLQEAGFIKIDEKGEITDWDAYCLSGGMSALVFFKDPDDVQKIREVKALLDHYKEEGVYGFSEVMTTEETNEKYHLDGKFKLVLETDGFTSFGDSPVRPLVRNFDPSDYRYGRATHGYFPELGPWPVLYCSGPDIKDGAMLKTADLVDEAPTLAEVLGVQLTDTDGRVLSELLK